ncbi:MAG: SAM-dependent methyltransferase, partial [Bacilli bacterium]|nr:SAM-dependent methyltransferase [Bacilli bacterium]
MKINERLKLVASFVEENSNVIDVGCDHALLDIYLFLN